MLKPIYVLVSFSSPGKAVRQALSACFTEEETEAHN